MPNNNQSENLESSLHVRLSPSIEKRLNEAAKANGQKSSSYARLLLVRSLHEIGNPNLPAWLR